MPNSMSQPAASPERSVTVHCIPFAFKQLLPTRFETEGSLANLYVELVTIWTGTARHAVHLFEPFYSAPIPFSYHRNAKYAESALEGCLPPPEKVDLIIVDFSMLQSKDTTLHWGIMPILNVISHIAELQSRGQLLAAPFFLFPSDLAPSDENWHGVLSELNKIKNMTAVIGGMEVIGAWCERADDALPRHRSATEEYHQGERKSVIDHSTIRHLGKLDFRNANGDVYPALVSFDGSLAATEIADEIAIRLQAENARHIANIVFQHSELNWMQSVRRLLILALKGDYSVIDIESASDLLHVTTKLRAAGTMVVAPLIRTKASVRAIDQSLVAILGPSHSRQYLAVYDASEPTQGETDGPEPSIACLVQKRRSDTLARIFPDRSAVPPISNVLRRSPSICATEYWLMTCEAGFEPELDVPEYRESLGLVPSGRLFSNNAGLLAYKIKRTLEDANIDCLDIAFLCSDDTNMKKISEILRQIMRAGVVELPKSVLEFASHIVGDAREDSKALRAHIDTYKGTERVSWLHMLYALTPVFARRTKVMLLDEFLVTGGKLKSLKRVARALKLDIVGSLVIFDYASTRMQRDADLRSLYRLPITDAGGARAASRV